MAQVRTEPNVGDRETVVALRDVSVHRHTNRQVILAEIDWTVRAGEHWALLGANGAGKTTLLRLQGALMHPTTGSVEVLGSRLGRVDVRELRARIGHPLFFAGNPGLQAGRECDPRPGGAKRRSSLRLGGEGQAGRFWFSMYSWTMLSACRRRRPLAGTS